MSIQENFAEILTAVRSRRPLIHCITNYVTANDVANMLLAAGASPVMADGACDAEEIAAASDGMVINLGTLKEETVETMLLAGKKAAALGHPIVLDPVGAGASAFRRRTAMRILREVGCSVVRGNASEIRALAQVSCVPARGVDVDERADLSAGNVRQTAELLRQFSRRTGAAVMMTGAVDVAADADHVWLVRNGDPMMKRITGSGCMLDGVTAAFLAAAVQERGVLVPVVAAAAVYGVCGELARERTVRMGGGTATFRTHLIDAMSLLDAAAAAARIRAEQLLPEETQNGGF